MDRETAEQQYGGYYSYYSAYQTGYSPYQYNTLGWTWEAYVNSEERAGTAWSASSSRRC